MEIRLLGPVQASVSGRSVGLGPRQQRLVFAVLALEVNRLVPVDRLVQLIWPVSPPRTAVHAVHVCVSRLRAVLAGIGRDGDAEPAVEIVGHRSGYVLRADPLSIDVHRFRACVDEARRTADDRRRCALLDAALALWSGPGLAGTAEPDVGARLFGGLEEARLVAVEDRMEIRLRLGQHREVLDDLSGLVAAHPVRERLVGQLMRAVYRSGRPADALDIYRQTKSRMAEELGLDPGPELRLLEVAILRGDPLPDLPEQSQVAEPDSGARPAQVPAQLPSAVAGFVGRATELARLDALLADHDFAGPAALITAISGTAGVGKTTLAVRWAHHVRQLFPDGQLYVNLRSFDPTGPAMEPAEALRRLLDAFEVPPERIPIDVEAQVGLYRSLLAGRRMLVVLDNAGGIEQVRPLLPGSSGCLALVTSRNRLTGLIAAEGVHSLELDLLATDEAREMLTRRVGRSRLAAEPQATDDIIELCARLPLALAIVAARATARPRYPLAALAGELRGARARLDALDADEPALDLRAVFSWSYQRLDSDAARMFRLLGLHPGPDLTLPAAASLAGVPHTRANTLLARLTRAHLVTESVAGRFTCHDLLRAYTVELVHSNETTDERRLATARMLDHYLHSAYAADRLQEPHRDPIALAPPHPDVRPEVFASHDQALAWFVAEHPVILALIRHADLTEIDTHTWELAWTLTVYLDRRGHWRDWAATQLAALRTARRCGDLARQAYTHRLLGLANIRLGRVDEAQSHLRQALDLFGRLADRTGQARAHADLARLAETRGDLVRALAHAQDALELHRAGVSATGQAYALNTVGWYHALLGDHEQAMAYCRQSLALHRQHGNRHGAAAAWDSLGYAHHHLGRHDDARDCYEHARELFRELGDRFYEALILTHLGDTYLAIGDITAAHAAWQTALGIFEEFSQPDADRVRAKLLGSKP